jgi:hypothetical protein
VNGFSTLSTTSEAKAEILIFDFVEVDACTTLSMCGPLFVKSTSLAAEVACALWLVHLVPRKVESEPPCPLIAKWVASSLFFELFL